MGDYAVFSEDVPKTSKDKLHSILGSAATKTRFVKNKNGYDEKSGGS